ncbi:MAG: hypothetical protein Q9160_002157 [Pyrenula sp. 1 TL-2023]
MVVHSTKHIDLLLGLLAFIGWSNYQQHSRPFLAVFTQLSVSLVFDLGLNKPVPKDAPMMLCVDQKHLKPTTPRTMEERRAVLGCFLITSIISSFLQKTDALRWTSHLDECLLVLDGGKECFNDSVLVHQVRLQLLLERMALGPSHDETIKSKRREEPTPFQHGNLISQLQDLKAGILSETQPNEVLLLHIHSADLETALSSTFLHTNQLSLQQRQALNASLQSIKAWFNVFFTILPAAYIGFPFTIISQLARCIMILYRWTTLDDLTGDESRSLEDAAPLLILDRVIKNLDQVADLAELDNTDSPEGDIFYRLAQMLRSFRPGWESRLPRDDVLLSNNQISPNLNESILPGSIELEFLDNDWLMDFILPPSQ